MLDTLFLIAVGAFLGWSFPQPVWAKAIQTVVVSWFRKSSQ